MLTNTQVASHETRIAPIFEVLIITKFSSHEQSHLYPPTLQHRHYESN